MKNVNKNFIFAFNQKMFYNILYTNIVYSTSGKLKKDEEYHMDYHTHKYSKLHIGDYYKKYFDKESLDEDTDQDLEDYKYFDSDDPYNRDELTRKLKARCRTLRPETIVTVVKWYIDHYGLEDALKLNYEYGGPITFLVENPQDCIQLKQLPAIKKLEYIHALMPDDITAWEHYEPYTPYFNGKNELGTKYMNDLISIFSIS